MSKEKDIIRLLLKTIETQVSINIKLEERLEKVEKLGKLNENKKTCIKEDTKTFKNVQKCLHRLLLDKEPTKYKDAELEQLAELQKQYEDVYYPSETQQTETCGQATALFS